MKIFQLKITILWWLVQRNPGEVRAGPSQRETKRVGKWSWGLEDASLLFSVLRTGATAAHGNSYSRLTLWHRSGFTPVGYEDTDERSVHLPGLGSVSVWPSGHEMQNDDLCLHHPKALNRLKQKHSFNQTGLVYFWKYLMRFKQFQSRDADRIKARKDFPCVDLNK